MHFEWRPQLAMANSPKVRLELIWQAQQQSLWQQLSARIINHNSNFSRLPFSLQTLFFSTAKDAKTDFPMTQTNSKLSFNILSYNWICVFGYLYLYWIQNLLFHAHFWWNLLHLIFFNFSKNFTVSEIWPFKVEIPLRAIFSLYF